MEQADSNHSQHHSQPVDPVTEISTLKRQLRSASMNSEQVTPEFLAECACRLEQTEHCLEQQPERIAKRIARLVEQEVLKELVG